MEDVVVVGAGIVGLATAREFLLRRPGASVTVLEKASEVGEAQTGHNSGVIHTGIYYAPGSLKARLCRIGERATKEFCTEHGIPFRVTAKLIVATNDVEVVRMAQLEERATINGIRVTRLSPEELREREPNIVGKGALLVHDTGIVDYRRVARCLADDIENMGGRVVTRSTVRGIGETSGPGAAGVTVLSDTGVYRARKMVACAGLQADRVAALGGIRADFQIVPFRGEYFQLPRRRQDVVKTLIYPVPVPNLPFLGVHLSPTIDGRVIVGPNAVLGFSREGYPRGSFNVKDVSRYTSFPGMWRFAKSYARIGISEMYDSLSVRRYLQQVQKYCPELTVSDLLPYSAGIRAQAVMKSGALAEDFLIRSTSNQIHVCNAPSPAATSSLPIARWIFDQYLARGEGSSPRSD